MELQLSAVKAKEPKGCGDMSPPSLFTHVGGIPVQRSEAELGSRLRLALKHCVLLQACGFSVFQPLKKHPYWFSPSPSFHFSSFSFSLGERGMKLQKSLCFLVWRAPSPSPLCVAKPEDADKAYRPAVQIASHKNPFYFSPETDAGEGTFQCELLSAGCIKVSEPGIFAQK